jgi:hypothetical protein
MTHVLCNSRTCCCCCLHAARRGRVADFIYNTHPAYDTHYTFYTAMLCYSSSQPHIPRRFINRRASEGDTQRAYFLPHTYQTILSQIPVTLRKSSIWLAVQSKFTRKVSIPALLKSYGGIWKSFNECNVLSILGIVMAFLIRILRMSSNYIIYSIYEYTMQ